MDKPLFTVFTPTFNRVNTLPRLYESLKAQTYRNFEWVIVDDGSTDRTKELIEKWQKEGDFLIRYFWQPNKGKHVAFNLGVKEAQGYFFLPLDSDDACLPRALERFKYHWDSIPKENKDIFSGVCGLGQDQNGRLVGNRFPFNPTDSDSLEIYYRYKVKGDKWGFQRTEVLRHYPFPEIGEAKFIPEGVVWNAIAKSYKIRFINEVLLIIYRKDDMTRSDQLTQSLRTAPWNYAVGCSLYYQLCLNEDMNWFRFAPLEFLRSAAHYIRFSLHSGVSISRALKNVRSIMGRILVILVIPIGISLFEFEKRGINLVLRYKSLSKVRVG